MIRLVVLLLIIAGVAGYFTRPDEAKMRQGADAVLNQADNPIEAIGNAGTAILGDRAFDDYYVATKYTVSFDHNPQVECWGYFTQVTCNRVQSASGETSH